MKKIFLVITPFVICFGLVIGIAYIFNQTHEQKNISTYKSNIVKADLKRITAFKNGKSNMPKGKLDKLIKTYGQPLKTINLFTESITKGDYNLFSQLFDQQQLNKDLFDNKNEDKIGLLKDWISQINHNKALKDIKILKQTKDEFNKTASFYLKFEYSKSRSAYITLYLKSIGTNDKEYNNVYLVTTSILDIVNQINKQVEEVS